MEGELKDFESNIKKINETFPIFFPGNKKKNLK